MSAERPVAVLVHGLWMNRWTMALLARRMERAGLATVIFGYPSMRESLDRNADALAKFLAAIDAPRLHLVGHSLGGIVCLRYLARSHDPRVQRCVLLGAPVRGNTVGARLARFRIGLHALGASASLWSGRMPELAIDARYEVGVIVGTRRIGIGATLFADRSAGDGVVRVDEADYPAARDRMQLDVSHSGMLVSRRIARQVIAFLSRGAFER